MILLDTSAVLTLPHGDPDGLENDVFCCYDLPRRLSPSDRSSRLTHSVVFVAIS